MYFDSEIPKTSEPLSAMNTYSTGFKFSEKHRININLHVSDDEDDDDDDAIEPILVIPPNQRRIPASSRNYGSEFKGFDFHCNSEKASPRGDSGIFTPPSTLKI